jgi:hypothetical protein
MKACNRGLPGPQRIHRGNIPRRERAVEFEIGGEHGIAIGHRFPRV